MWVSRAGVAAGSIGEPGPYGQLALSPDGTQVALDRRRGQLAEIWLVSVNVQGGVPRRLTGQGASEAVWSSDSRELAYVLTGIGFVKQSIDESHSTALHISGGILEDWSRDGRYLLRLSRGLAAVPLSGEKKPIVLADDSGIFEAQFSPDGKWVAYTVTDSGRTDIYVQPFPGPGERIRVSTNGGTQPKWRGDGHELFYLTLEGEMMAVDLSFGNTIVPATPKLLFKTALGVSTIVDQYAVTGDGQRFLLLTPTGENRPSSITVLVNWAARLGR